MTPEELHAIIRSVACGGMQIEEAARRVTESAQGYAQLDGAMLDTDRQRRRGTPEVIYCEGKRPEEIAEVAAAMVLHSGLALGTRCPPDAAGYVIGKLGAGDYDEISRTLRIGPAQPVWTSAITGVIAAGTSDRPVAEEACRVLETFGAPVERIYDVGVAGIHRLMAHTDRIAAATVLIVVAGMEGALPSVVAGMTWQPVIAVPTSIGYGVALGGLTALFAMLTSCAGGVTVVNIDNGFGAAIAALSILRIGESDCIEK